MVDDQAVYVDTLRASQVITESVHNIVSCGLTVPFRVAEVEVMPVAAVVIGMTAAAEETPADKKQL